MSKVEEIERLRESNEGQGKEILKLMKKLNIAKAECDKLRKALQFYAFSNWNENYPGGISYDDNGKIYLDYGEVAQIALKEKS